MNPKLIISDDLSNMKERVHLIEAWKAGKLEPVPNLYYRNIFLDPLYRNIDTQSDVFMCCLVDGCKGRLKKPSSTNESRFLKCPVCDTLTPWV